MSSVLVTAEQWKEQFKNYLCSDKNIHSLWEKLQKGETVSDNAVASLYSHWEAFSMDHMEALFADIAEVTKQKDYNTHFENRYLSRSGIIVEKSSIPYIY